MAEEKNNKEVAQRDYDKERQEIFSEALKKIDPNILQAIELVQKMNSVPNNQFQITVSSIGTSH